MKCNGTETKAQQKMAAGSPFSGYSVYETGPLLSWANTRFILKFLASRALESG